MKLTPEQSALLPTESDVAFYREHGYYVSQKIFSDEEIDDAIYGTERYYGDERDFRLPSIVKSFEGWNPTKGDVLRQNDYVSLQNQEISVLVRHPLIGAIAARLCGDKTIRLWHDQLIYKPLDRTGERTVVGWHTDRAYWKTCTSHNMLTAWIPFQDCDDEIGPLVFIDGSHEWRGNSERKSFHENDLDMLEKDIKSGGRPLNKVPMNLQKGQVSFHHCKLIHGSMPNRSTTPRLSLSVHLQDGANTYREYRRSNGELVWHYNDVLCRKVNGQPDYRDPDFCPVLWQEEEAAS